MKLGIALCAVLAGCTDERLVERENPDWPGYELPTCDTTRRAYRIDALEISTNSSEAEALGWDLDGDDTVDNQGGNIMAAVIQALGVDLQGAVDEALDADLVQIGVVVEACASPRYALVSPVRGLELDRSSGRARMFGEAVTRFAAVSVDGLPGPAIEGTSRFPAGQLLHPIADQWIDARKVTVVIDELSDDAIAGTISAGLDGQQVFDAITVAFQAKVADRIDELGPCTPQQCDDVLRRLFDTFDADSDGEITLEEVRSDSVTQTLLRPDLDTDRDGEEDSLSIGVGFRATPIELIIDDVNAVETP